MQKNASKFDEAFLIFRLMLDKKANPNATDSYGNNALHRAILDSRQMIDNPNADLTNGILLQQLKKVFSELILAGADINSTTEKRPSAMIMLTQFRLDQYELI
ncbi:MAG: hypothetical protein QM727_13640 [Niabella sp.]